MLAVVNKLLQDWFEELAAVIVTALVTIFLAVWSGFWKRARYFFLINVERYLNISREEALGIAKERVGARIIQVVPFRNRDSSHQYIAVLDAVPISIGDPFPYPKAAVKVLEGDEDIYQVLETELKVGDMFGPLRFGVLDVDQDGNKEIYTITRDGGTGWYGFQIQVYDTLTHEYYTLQGGGSYSDPSPEVEFSANTKEKKNLANWFRQEAAKLNLNVEKSEYDKAIQAWLRDNGRGFYEGQLKVRYFDGELTIGSTALCTVDDGEYIWRSYFKGAVLGYDKTKDASFVVYVPDNAYEWVSYLVSGKQYLWMSPRDKPLLALDKTHFTLRSLPIDKDSEDQSWLSEAVRKKPLPMLDDIDLQVEFEDFVTCEESAQIL